MPPALIPSGIACCASHLGAKARLNHAVIAIAKNKVPNHFSPLSLPGERKKASATRGEMSNEAEPTETEVKSQEARPLDSSAEARSSEPMCEARPSDSSAEARIKWTLRQSDDVKFGGSEGPNVDGQPAKQRLVGYSPWKPLAKVKEEVAILDGLPNNMNWYTYEIQEKPAPAPVTGNEP